MLYFINTFKSGVILIVHQQAYWFAMDFPKRLSTFRKEKGLTQKILSDQVGVHVVQIRRYEAGDAQPTLEVIKQLAIALSVSADQLIFDKNERGPEDDLKLQFEAIGRLTLEEKQVIKTVIESIIIKHDAQSWVSSKQN